MKKILPNSKVMDIEQLHTKIISLETRPLHVKSFPLKLPKHNRASHLYYQVKRAKQWFFHGAKAWLTFAPGSRPRRIAKKILIVCRNYVLCRPWLKSILLNHLTRLEHILRRINLALMQNNDATPSEKQSSCPPQDLTPRAQEIYTKLATHFWGR